MITKKLEQETNLVIKFTEDEMAELGIDKNDKFTISVRDDECIILEPYAKVEIDLESYDKKTLIHMIQMSAEQDISINEVIEQILTEVMKEETDIL